ncbi:MAG: hypothetical protein ACP5N7_04715 [Candidatus Pacearchaeota archaeon]
MRRLIYVPLVHDISEFPKEIVRANLGPNPSKPLIRRFQEGLGKYWDRVDPLLMAQKIDRIYQDSCVDFFDLKHYLEKYRAGADKSRNFRAICYLLDGGAKLMITESNYAKNESYFEESVIPRDNYIASRIDFTLEDKETGVLFMGINHVVDQIIRKRY